MVKPVNRNFFKTVQQICIEFTHNIDITDLLKQSKILKHRYRRHDIVVSIDAQKQLHTVTPTSIPFHGYNYISNRHIYFLRL